MNNQTIQSTIETLEYTKRVIGDENEVLMKPIDESIQDLRQALEQPEQEPVGYVSDSGNIAVIAAGIDLDDDTPVYAAPPKREWVGLTDDEIEQGLLRSDYALHTAHAWRSGVIFAMTKLKEKNT